jgi:hypothetical protein
MLLTTAVVYKVMKKVGKLTEARMVLPPEPKVYPMVSDRLFEGKVKRKKKLKEVEVPDPRDLASNRPPKPSLSTTNSPRRATPASVQVGGPYDLTAEANLQELTPAGKQAAAERARQQAAKKRGDHGEEGAAEAARKYNISIRKLRPRTPSSPPSPPSSPGAAPSPRRVPGKKYREDAV